MCACWLKVDVVQLEDASPQLRCRILKEQPIPDNMYLELKTRIEDELIRIDQTWRVVETVLAQAGTVGPIFMTPTRASYRKSDRRGGFYRQYLRPTDHLYKPAPTQPITIYGC